MNEPTPSERVQQALFGLDELSAAYHEGGADGHGLTVKEFREHRDPIRAQLLNAAAALASTSIDGVSGTGLEELRRLSDAADAEEASEATRKRRYPRTVWENTTAREEYRTAALAHVRAALAKDGEEGGGG